MFKLAFGQRSDKSIQIVDNQTELHIYVDYDDVDHDAVDEALPRILNALNREFHGEE